MRNATVDSLVASSGDCLQDYIIIVITNSGQMIDVSCLALLFTSDNDSFSTPRVAVHSAAQARVGDVRCPSISGWANCLTALLCPHELPNKLAAASLISTNELSPLLIYTRGDNHRVQRCHNCIASTHLSLFAIRTSEFICTETHDEKVPINSENVDLLFVVIT